MAGVHRNDVRVAAAEQDTGCLAGLHDPASAVNEAIGMCDGVAYLSWSAFVVGMDDCLGDAVGELQSIIRLCRSAVCSHGSGCGVSVGSADKDLFGAKRGFFTDDLFGLVDDIGGDSEAIDDAQSDSLGR